MPARDDGDNLPEFAASGQFPQRDRYELLLRAVRYLLARHVSFTQIEDALVAGGIAPDKAERLVELVIQDIQGGQPALDRFEALDVPPEAFDALGFAVDLRSVAPNSLLGVALGRAPAPEFAFAASSEVPTRAVRRGTPVAVLLLTACIVALTVLGVVLLALK